jgi:hypothetical protein
VFIASLLHAMQFIPWLVEDVGARALYYIYTAKGRFKKGANRLCTCLYFLMLAALEDPTTCTARKMAYVGDNYSENKNLTLLVFATMVVMMGWKDEIQFLFGPVGHTHNGKCPFRFSAHFLSATRLSMYLAACCRYRPRPQDTQQ